MDHLNIPKQMYHDNQNLLGFVALYHPAVRKNLQTYLDDEEMATLLPAIPADMQARIDESKSLNYYWKKVPYWELNKMWQTPEDRMIACGWVGGERVRTGM